MIELMLAGGGGVNVEYTEYTRLVGPASGVLVRPEGAKAMRVAVIGAGGGGGGSGGGGCAATKIVKASDITYTLPQYSVNAEGQDSIAEFDGYYLIGGGGKLPYMDGSTYAGGPGGVGSGGDFNFMGGSGGRFTYYPSVGTGGGGAAGPNGNGGDGGDQSTGVRPGLPGEISGSGWGVGGGGGGASAGSNDNSTYAGGGGGGAGCSGGDRMYILSGSNFSAGGEGRVIFGTGGVSGEGNNGGYGGEMGGGGGGRATSASRGGAGGMVVEWFF